MNRRKFIKTGLQVGGAGLMASTLGCQGSLFDSFAQPATEAIVTGTGVGAKQIFRVNLSTGATSQISDGSIFPNIHASMALLDQDTALLTTNQPGGDLYKLNLNTNTVQLLTSGYLPGIIFSGGIALENRNSLLIGSSDGALRRMNLNTLTVTQTQTIDSDLRGIALESKSFALVLDQNNSIYRVNLTDLSFSSLGPVTGGQGRHIALDTTRDIALIGQSGASQIERFDLSTNTTLTSIGSLTGGAGRGIALENSSSVLVGDNSGGLYRVNLDTGATSRVDDGTLSSITPRAIAVRFQ